MTPSYPPLLWFSTAMALLGSFQFGFAIAVFNTSLDYVAQSLDFDVDTSGAFIVSTLLIGAFFGALFAGSFADFVGPKKATIYNTIPFILGTILSATATSKLTIIFGRFIVGIGTGAASLFVPRYLTEISPTPIRGLLGTCNQIFINAGIVTAFAMGWPYSSGTPQYYSIFGFHNIAWWRIMTGSGLIPACLQAIGMSFCPETPVWLLWSGFHSQATKAYKALHGYHAPSTVPQSGTDAQNTVLLENISTSSTVSPPLPPVPVPLSRETQSPYSASIARNDSDYNPYNTMQDYINDDDRAEPFDRVYLVNTASSVMTTADEDDDEHVRQQSQQHEEGFTALFEKKYRRIMLLALSIPLLQQFGGINTVILYGSDVFKKSGIESPIAANLIMGCINMVATLVAAGLMDKAGRRVLLTGSFAGMGVFLGFMAIFLFLPSYIICFALGCGPIPWVYLPEILPSSIKGRAQATATALNWIGNLAVGLSFPSMLHALGLGGAYAFYAVFCGISAAFCAKYMVETKQRSLSRVHAELMHLSSSS